MTRWHNHYVDGHAHFCTATVSGWRSVLLANSHIIYQEWADARNVCNAKILAYVLMPEHFHIIIWAEHGEDVLHFLQRSMSRISKRIEPDNGRFWKERPRILPLFSKVATQARIDYLHNNPLRKQFVQSPEDWTHSSYRQIVTQCANVKFLCDNHAP